MSQKVITGPGKQEIRPCLVVVLSNSADGQPCIAYFSRPEKLGILGSEYQVLNKVNKTTCIFWPVKENDREALKSELSLVSIGEFKRDDRTLEKPMGPYLPQQKESRDLPYMFQQP